MEEDNMANTALTFVFLFLFTLFYSIGVTVFKNWNKGTKFKCEAKHMSMAYSETLSKCKDREISPPQIRLEKPRLKSVLEEKLVTASCFVESDLNPVVSWYVDGNQMNQGISTVSQEGTTFCNLTMNADKWKTLQTLECKADHICFSHSAEKKINFTKPQKSPTVVIRRNLADIQKGHTTVLECAATDLPSGELLVTFQANGVKFSQDQYVDLPQGLDSLTRRVTVPTEHQKTDKSFTCQIESQSGWWKSSPTGNIFGEPSVDLSVVSSVETKGSQTLKLLCSGTGLNPMITWQHAAVNKANSGTTMEADGRVKVFSEGTVTQQEWNTGTTFTCQVSDHTLNKFVQKNTSICAGPQKSPTVVIRRNLADIQKGHTTVLECAATDLPSGELLVTFQANGVKFSQDQYVDLPQGLDSLTRRVTVPTEHQKTDKSFTCQIESQSGWWKSSSTGNIFGEPSVDLSVVSSVETKGSQTQKLLCSGTGLNPMITWQDAAVNKINNGTTMEADGRVKVFSEGTVTQQEWNNGTTFTCQVSDHNLNKPVQKNTSICAVTPDSAQLVQVYLLAPSISDLKANKDKVPVTCLLLGLRLNASSFIWKVGGPQKSPTVVIRRNLADIEKGHTTVLECAATDLPSGELLVTFQANGVKFSQDQYVDLPQGLDSLTRHVTVPTEHQKTDKSFTCQIESQSGWWKSSPTGNIFGEPSVDLSVVSSVETKGSQTQKLLCSGTGLNPMITWQPPVVNKANNGTTMEADGRVKVFSEGTVTQQEWNTGDTFTCQVSDHNLNKPVQKNTSICAVTPDSAQLVQVYLLAPSISDLKANKDKVPVTCLLLGHRLNAFSITWKVENNIHTPDATKEIPKVHSNGTESLRSVLKVQATKWNAHKTVSYPKKPTIQILSPSDDELSEIHKRDLLCLIEGFHPADISVHWELDGIRLDASRVTNSTVDMHSESAGYSMHSTLTLLASKMEDGTFSCVVIHESSETPIEKTIKNIYASVKQTVPTLKLLNNQDELLCLAYDYSPSAINITWLRNSVSLTNVNSTSNSAKGPNGKFSIQSHLYVQASEWVPGDTYTCQVKHITGIITRSISKSET
ncbi:hypothetical protein QTP86_005111 [Hemibagrus guttatus]|nr:hypothetical protein QTP86_005111 [Hemibagrus guttatus]